MSNVPDVSRIDHLCDEIYGTSAHLATQTAWQQAVHSVAQHAKAVLPAASAERVDKAEAIVLAGAVELLPDGTAHVASSKTGEYHLANGTCDCEDFAYRAPAQWCKHRIARGLYLRASRAVEDAPAVEAPAVEVPADIPAQYVVELHGKQFVIYPGLLALAHARGLVSLSARFISVTPELAIAEATAVFADGRTFTEAADATPGNVGAKVKAHFSRMALTRAKARCLRDALNVSMCSLEEVE